MILSLLPLAAVILAAWIQRPNRSRKDQWASSYRSALGVTAVFSLVAVGSAVIRGLSVTSLALVGLAMTAVGCLFCLLSGPTVEFGKGSLQIKVQRVRYFNPRTWILTLWSAIVIIGLAGPLSFAGAFSGDAAASEFVARFVPDQLDPNSQVRNISEGQCLHEREPQAQNRVYSCVAPHRAEVLEEIDTEDDCPRVPPAAAEGYRMRIERTQSISGTRFCVLLSEDPSLTWSGGFTSLPETD